MDLEKTRLHSLNRKGIMASFLHRFKNKYLTLLIAFLLCTSTFIGCTSTFPDTSDTPANDVVTAPHSTPKKTETTKPKVPVKPVEAKAHTLDDIPEYTGKPYVEINNNVPDFSEEDIKRGSFEEYAPLDKLGRCVEAFALIGKEIMPTEKRGSIGAVKPSGWHLVKYDCVDGKYLYNRCHLIGYQLAGENANVRNLITGTRYLNVTGMLPFEDKVDDYVNATGNHVLYRVNPIFNGDDLVAQGVAIQAYSIEDEGKGVSFYVFCYNVQPGVTIDYKTGDSTLNSETQSTESETSGSEERDYVLNTNTKKFHLPDCSSVDKMKDKNREDYFGTRDDLIDQGYVPCKRCNP